MKNKALRAAFAAISFLCLKALAFAQEGSDVSAVLRYGYSGRYSYTERANLLTYINGKYAGLTHREVRAAMNSSGQSEAGTAFFGFFYVAEETRRDMRNVSLPLDAAVPASFTVTETGQMLFSEDNGYPRMRNFPAFPDGEIKAGDSWEAEAVRIVDPKNTGATAEIPVHVGYTFAGLEEYRGKKVYRIKARYATRMGKHTSVRAISRDPDLTDATGTHDADILVDSETGLLMMIAETLDETFAYSDGSTVRFRGSSAVHAQQSMQTEKGELPRAINRIAQEAGEEAATKGIVMPESADDTFANEAPSATGGGMAEIAEAVTESAREGNAEETTAPFTVSVTEQGIKLSVRDIRFRPDSDEILPEEAWRLDAIAQTLKIAEEAGGEGQTFLVEGHTAAVGKPNGEKELSVRRAERITQELSKRGISADRFMYAGHGGTRPVADNATSEGRAQNRRVEITIVGAE